MSLNQETPVADGTDRQPGTARERDDLQQPRRIGGGLLDPKMLWKSLPDAFKKLDPRVQLHNPVMFVVEVGSVLTTYSAIIHPSAFAWTITAWLWLTVLFANLAEAVAEGRGRLRPRRCAGPSRRPWPGAWWAGGPARLIHARKRCPAPS
jgi:hypothetical protein